MRNVGKTFPALKRLSVFGFLFLATVLLVGIDAVWSAQPISPPVEAASEDPRFFQYTLKAGSAFHGLLQAPLSTAVNKVNDPVAVITDHNLYVGEHLLLPKSTRLTGYVQILEPPIEGRDALLGIIFNQIILQNGDQLPLNAHVRTEREDHAWGGHLTRGTKALLSTQRVQGIGEYNRIVYGGPRAMGQHTEINAGEPLILILDKPLTLLLPKPDAF